MSGKYSHFNKTDRMELSILLKRGYSYREIGRVLGKNHSSIGREVKNNSVKGAYCPAKAHTKAKVKRLGSKYQGMKVCDHPKLGDYIEQKLKIDHWAPEQIANRWNLENPDEVGISGVSIYKYLYSCHGQRLCRHLLSQRYQRRKNREKKPKRELIPNRVSIDDRPDDINNRKRFGHFEADTLGKIKTDSHVLAGLVERVSRKVLFVKVPRMKYAMDGFKNCLNPYQSIMKSVTFDNGVENFRHQELGVDTYFCHPYSSWEKGQIENSFKRLRRFIPKGSSLKNFSSKDIFKFQELMNNTPRKCLAWKTPNEVFEEHLNKV